MQKRQAAVIVVFFLLVWGFLLTFFLLPDAANSYSERRKLQQVPQMSAETVRSGAFAQDAERYAQDQFPLREVFRQAKARLNCGVLGQLDSNGIYLVDGSAVKMEWTLKEDEVRACAEKINEISARYLQGMQVYCAVVPDKHYYASALSGRPSLDYEKMITCFQEALTGASYLDLFDTLHLSDYYRTDAHWRQEALGEVRAVLAKALGIEDRLPPMDSYERQAGGDFSGVYRGQSALPMATDQLVYLDSPTLRAAQVTSAEQGGPLPVYAPEKIRGMDGYDVFLHGAQAVLTIDNPLAQQKRELILFRDSFGSSVAPLLLDAYSRITLIDLRYVRSDYLHELISFADQDVLFLYSTGIVNSGRLLR